MCLKDQRVKTCCWPTPELMNEFEFAGLISDVLCLVLDGVEECAADLPASDYGEKCAFPMYLRMRGCIWGASHQDNGFRSRAGDRAIIA